MPTSTNIDQHRRTSTKTMSTSMSSQPRSTSLTTWNVTVHIDDDVDAGLDDIVDDIPSQGYTSTTMSMPALTTSSTTFRARDIHRPRCRCDQRRHRPLPLLDVDRCRRRGSMSTMSIDVDDVVDVDDVDVVEDSPSLTSTSMSSM